MEIDFFDPLYELIEIGEPVEGDWMDYTRLGIGPEHLAGLVGTAQYRALLDLPDDDPSRWGPIHAVRAMAELQDPRAPELLTAMLPVCDFDDPVGAAIREALSFLGAQAVPACAQLLHNPGTPTQARWDVANVVCTIGLRDESARGLCIDVLERVLHTSEWLVPPIATAVVVGLGELKAVECLPVVRSVFDTGILESVEVPSWSTLEAGFREPYVENDEVVTTVEGRAWPTRIRAARVRVTLRETDPPVWREIELPAESTLCRLHHVIQKAFGWRTDALYEFHTPVGRYGDLRLEADQPQGDLDARSARLAEFASPPFGLVYTYDFADGWVHEVDVLEIPSELRERSELPRCLAGARAVPPEGCPGTRAYVFLLAAMSDPTHEEYEHLHELTGNFDPDRFDLDETNRRMRGTDWR